MVETTETETQYWRKFFPHLIAASYIHTELRGKKQMEWTRKIFLVNKEPITAFTRFLEVGTLI